MAFGKVIKYGMQWFDDALGGAKYIDEMVNKVPSPKALHPKSIQPYHDAAPVKFKGRTPALRNNPEADQMLGNAYQWMSEKGPSFEGFGTYTAPDGMTYNIKGSRSLQSVYDKFMETGNKVGLKMQDVGRVRKSDGVSSDGIRKINSAKMTYEGSENEFYKQDRLPQPEGSKAHSPHRKEPHHIRGVQQYEPFFEGLGDEDAAELARYAAEDLNAPLGNTKLNRADIAHLAHKGATGKGIGYHVWESRYKGGRLNTKSKKNMYNIDKNTTLAERKELMRQYILTDQMAAEQALFIEQMAYQNPDHPYWQDLVRRLRNQELDLGSGFDSGPSGIIPSPKALQERPQYPPTN